MLSNKGQYTRILPVRQESLYLRTVCTIYLSTLERHHSTLTTLPSRMHFLPSRSQTKTQPTAHNVLYCRTYRDIVTVDTEFLSWLPAATHSRLSTALSCRYSALTSKHLQGAQSHLRSCRSPYRPLDQRSPARSES
jgi:hypothetical protein